MVYQRCTQEADKSVGLRGFRVQASEGQATARAMFRASDIFGKRAGNNAGADALREKAHLQRGL